MASVPCVPDLVLRLRAAPPRCGSTKLVCVDGPAGSGKTTLAQELSRALGAVPVVHMDDLYQGWGQPLGAELAARVDDWLLSSWAHGSVAHYRRYDWARDRYGPGWTEVPAAPEIILEGCASASRGIRTRASVVVWVEAPEQLRARRGLARDGPELAEQWRAWQRHETEHFAADGTRSAAHMIVDGTTGHVVSGGAPGLL